MVLLLRLDTGHFGKKSEMIMARVTASLFLWFLVGDICLLH